MKKLVRATVPMCHVDGCDGIMEIQHSPIDAWVCVRCGWIGQQPHWGVYVPDVAGTVKQLRIEADLAARPGQMDRLNALADELESTDKGES